MSTDKSQNFESTYASEEESGINLLDFCWVVWKRRKLIGMMVCIIMFATLVSSLFMKNIYQANALIVPVTSKDSSSGGSLSVLAQQFSSLPGISLPGSTSSAEIISLLQSNILREQIIKRYQLMPILFPDKWDSRKNKWKLDQGIDLNPINWLSNLSGVLSPSDSDNLREQEKKGVPQIWDALRLLDDIVQVTNNVKDNTISLKVEFNDPELAAKIAGYFLDTLTEHMSAEAKRVALTNRVYLEEQLQKTADPLIRQKIYNLIAQQVETAMMAEVKENFAFKVIDPPKAPDKKVKPKRALMLVLSCVLALFLGVFVSLVMEYLEKSRRSNQGEELKVTRGEG